MTIEPEDYTGDEQIEGDFTFVDQEGFDRARFITAIVAGDRPLALDIIIDEIDIKLALSAVPTTDDLAVFWAQLQSL